MEDFNNILFDIEDYSIDKQFILDIHNNSIYNNIIINYYKKYFNEKLTLEDLKEFSRNGKFGKVNKFFDKIESLRKCNQFWSMEVYSYNQVKDFVSTNLCKDKFCNNCKKVKQASRMSRYIPHLKPYSNNLYHITLTIPNVVGEQLQNTLSIMASSFKRLIRYINGSKKIGEIDFSKYGYLGAIRSLEITFKNNEYHPHYHCAFVFNDLDLTKIYKNEYSIDYFGNRTDRLFSEFEILIQKLWYLCINGFYITKKVIDNLELGYSCLIEQFSEDSYAELFKYITKETDEEHNMLTYDNFKCLYESLYRIKQIQGYGVFYQIIDEKLDEEIEKIYADIKDFLITNEKPQFELNTPFNLLNNNEYTIISRKQIYQYLRDIK